MKQTSGKILEAVIDFINFIIIGFALSCMTQVYRTNVLSVLFGASYIWSVSVYYKKLECLTGKKWLAWVLLLAAVAITTALFCVTDFPSLAANYGSRFVW